MSSVVRPIRPGESADPEVNKLLEQARDGWWNDAAMFGVIARQPDLLKKIVPVFEAFFTAGRFPPYMFELMRLKTGEINRCAYCATVRVAGIRDEVAPKEGAVFGKPDQSALSRREYLGVKLAEYMAGDPNYIPESFYKELKAEFSRNSVVADEFAVRSVPTLLLFAGGTCVDQLIGKVSFVEIDRMVARKVTPSA